jgi:hypothetical protein
VFGTGLGLLAALGGLGTAGKHLYVLAHPGLSCGIDPMETAQQTAGRHLPAFPVPRRRPVRRRAWRRVRPVDPAVVLPRCRHAGAGLGCCAAAHDDTSDEIRAGLSLAAARSVALLDPLDNRILLCHALGLSASPDHAIRAHAERRGSARYGALVQRRLPANRSPTSSASANSSACRSKSAAPC